MTGEFVDITNDEPAGAGRRGRVRRWLTGPPRWLFGVLVGATALLTLVTFAFPAQHFGSLALAVLAWQGIALIYLARLGLTLVAGGGFAELRRRWVLWIIVPAIVTATLGLVLTNAPLRVGLQLAAPAMISYAEEAGTAAPTRVGPYAVADAERFPDGGARFAIEGTGFLDRGGFAYSPYGPPPVLGDDMYKHIGGAWYVWIERF